MISTRTLALAIIPLAGLSNMPQARAATQDVAGQQQPAGAAGAQEQAAADSGGDIVVTARRRGERLLDTPVAITALSGATLERQGAIDITDIQTTVPNTTLKNTRGTNSTLSAFIRGVGQQDPVPGFEAGVGIYLDDVYLNRPQAAVLDIYDVERIEVLRGPQGTLYGRNTIGGAIKYVTRRLPDEFEAKLKGSFGSYTETDGIVSLAAPLGSGFKAGITGAILKHDGFGKDLTLHTDNYNKDVRAVRGTVEFNSADDRIFARVTGDYTDDKSNPRYGYRLIPGIASGTPVLHNVYDTLGGLNLQDSRVKAGGVSGSIDYKLTDHVTVRSITAWRKDKSLIPVDLDSLPVVDVDVPQIYKNSQFSQEVQLAYKSSKLNGILGYYYLHGRAQAAFDALLSTTVPGLSSLTAGDVRTDTHSLYGDFTYDFTSRWSLSLGGRYTWDERHASVFRANYIGGVTSEFGGNPTQIGAPTTNFTGKANFKRFTPRASLSFKPSHDQMLYASYSQGFKGGGFDPRGSGTSAPISNPAVGRTYQDIYNFLLFKPETVKSYEIGWKGALLDRRLTWSLASFYSDYSDVQIPGAVGCNVGGVQSFCGITTNAGKAHIKGVELEANAILARDWAGPGSTLSLAPSLGYIDAKYKRFIGPTGVDIADVRVFQNTPKWTVSGSLLAAMPVARGQLTVSTTVSYRSLTHQFETASPFLDQPGYALWDGSIEYSFHDGRYSVALQGKNLTNKHYITSGWQFINSTIAGVPIRNAQGGYTPTLGKEGIVSAWYGNPRQVLVTLSARF